MGSALSFLFRKIQTVSRSSEPESLSIVSTLDNVNESHVPRSKFKSSNETYVPYERFVLVKSIATHFSSVVR